MSRGFVIHINMEHNTTPDPQLVIWVQTWQRATHPLEELRRTELMAVDTAQALANLADAFESCRLQMTPRPESGLVRQQALFRRLRS